MAPLQNLLPSSVATVQTGKSHTLEDIKLLDGWRDVPLVEMEQVHGNSIEILQDLLIGRLAGADGVITTLKGVGLTVRTADCLPVLLHHPDGIIGALHAGRKGTEAGIVIQAATILKDAYGIKDGLHAWFGPAICERCYQIDRETDTHYNLLRNNIEQLYAVFSPENIDIHFANICTKEDKNYHSYRESGEGVGMNYAVIRL